MLNGSERNLWMRALAASSDHYSLQQYLHHAIYDSVKTQDVRTIFEAVAANPAGAQIAWRELQMSWPALVKKFGEVKLNFEDEERILKVTLGSVILAGIVSTGTNH